MLFMVIEHFKNRDTRAVYRRVEAEGRGFPEGLVYVDSWVEATHARCYQLVECDDPRLLFEWAATWSDLVNFEFHPVVSSKDAREVCDPRP